MLRTAFVGLWRGRSQHGHRSRLRRMPYLVSWLESISICEIENICWQNSDEISIHNVMIIMCRQLDCVFYSLKISPNSTARISLLTVKKWSLQHHCNNAKKKTIPHRQ